MWNIDFISQIDLATNNVTTIAGNGKQGTDKQGGKSGKEQEISSPWDIAVGPAPGFLWKSFCVNAQSVFFVDFRFWSLLVL